MPELSSADPNVEHAFEHVRVAQRSHIDRLETSFGRSACGRRAIVRAPELDLALDRLAASPPETLQGLRVVQTETENCLRFELEDGGFLMLRRSGTESMIRIYAEAESDAALVERLDAGLRLVEPESGRS